jgi:hypothetical protein
MPIRAKAEPANRQPTANRAVRNNRTTLPIREHEDVNTYTSPTDGSRPSGQRTSMSVIEDREGLDNLLSGFGILPEQYSLFRGNFPARSPEVTLMCAVLEDAMICFKGQLLSRTRQARRLGREAEEWLFNDDSRWIFSFASICGVLDLDADYIRKGLKLMRQQSEHPLEHAAAMAAEVTRRVA